MASLRKGTIDNVSLSATDASSARSLGAAVWFRTDAAIAKHVVSPNVQKRLIAEHFGDAGWQSPQLFVGMQASPDFYFHQTHQVYMDSWSKGRVVLVGDAGYSVSPVSGQGTTVAMVGGYVLAGELASNRQALPSGISAYETNAATMLTAISRWP